MKKLCISKMQHDALKIAPHIPTQMILNKVAKEMQNSADNFSNMLVRHLAIQKLKINLGMNKCSDLSKLQFISSTHEIDRDR